LGGIVLLKKGNPLAKQQLNNMEEDKEFKWINHQEWVHEKEWKKKQLVFDLYYLEVYKQILNRLEENYQSEEFQNQTFLPKEFKDKKDE